MVSIEHLQSSAFFRDFKNEHLSKIAKLCREERFQAQDFIVKEGEEAKKIYVLMEGIVTIQIHLREHKDVIVSTIEEKGGLFGWSALVEPKSYSAAAKCLNPTRVLSIYGEELEKLFKDDPVLGHAFMKKIASLIDRRLFTTRNRLISCIS